MKELLLMLTGAGLLMVAGALPLLYVLHASGAAGLSSLVPVRVRAFYYQWQVEREGEDLSRARRKKVIWEVKARIQEEEWKETVDRRNAFFKENGLGKEDIGRFRRYIPGGP